MTYQSWYDSLTWQDKVRHKVTSKIYKVEEWVDLKFDYPGWNDHTSKLRRVLCLFLGHSPEPDHCGIPAHDLCGGCGKSMPYQAKRGQVGT